MTRYTYCTHQHLSLFFILLQCNYTFKRWWHVFTEDLILIHTAWYSSWVNSNVRTAFDCSEDKNLWSNLHPIIDVSSPVSVKSNLFLRVFTQDERQWWTGQKCKYSYSPSFPHIYTPVWSFVTSFGNYPSMTRARLKYRLILDGNTWPDICIWDIQCNVYSHISIVQWLQVLIE